MTADSETALSHAILGTERLRVSIVIGFLAFLLVSAALFVPLLPGTEGWRMQGNWLLGVAGSFVLLVLVLGYELVVRYVIDRRLRTNRRPSAFLRYQIAAVEVSLPTLIILLAALPLGPLNALNMPAALGYFVFIALAPLSLRFWVCFFTGALAALEYVTLALVCLASEPPGAVMHPDLQLGHFISRGLLMIAAGWVAGHVALLIRSQFVRALSSVEERNRVLEVFGKYTAPEVVEQLLAQQVELGGEVRRVCVLFLDIRDFTRFSSTRPPEEVVQFLNQLFEPMIEIVNRHRGTINKFLGDGFMAVFGAPTSQGGRDVPNAVAAAHDILAAVERQNTAATATRIGIGIHVGEAVVGTVGSARRKEYTIIGRTVNLASRIEGLNKQFGSQLLVSAAVWSEVGGAYPAAVARGPVEVKGEATPVEIYQLA